MRKQGFTLIELLVVIVILTIIDLIVTATILGVIEKDIFRVFYPVIIVAKSIIS